MPLLGVSANLGTTVTAVLGTTPAAAPSTPTTPTPTTTPTTPDTPAAPGVGPARDFGMKVGETVYLNVRQGVPPTAWVPYTVAYLFADGNAVLIREPDCVAYTGDMAIGTNLRRKGGEYGDSTPGP